MCSVHMQVQNAGQMLAAVKNLMKVVVKIVSNCYIASLSVS